MTSKQEIIEALQNRIVTVKFKKANGDERVMKCTLLNSAIPPIENNLNRTEAERRSNPDVVAA